MGHMVVSISLSEVLIFVLSVVGIIILIYLGFALKNINSILKDIKYIVDRNKNNLDNTIASLPAIASNVKAITGEVSEGITNIAATAETIEKNIADSSGSIVKKTEIAVDYVQVISEIIKAGINYLEKRKRKRK
ncbi:hypothetical protein K9O30_06370 [Clostridium bowmanii]|uniref:hypothetical protein n=1 Tax=Clostridium bowmanii TaxID=132925 RepID=UPI001C0C912D|nr:hypothetical protein [Clostridium bowmanii]MBU3188783.1 hypothetical protein [Clostridium bowmanii]MCA1073367.1 hypothetical protein [Clostridium bowmanii]